MGSSHSAGSRRFTVSDQDLSADASGAADGPITLMVQAGNGGPRGAGQENESASAFDDSLVGGAGRDVIAGDAQTETGGTISLRARAGNGRNGDGTGASGSGGDGAVVRAFNDRLCSGSGPDSLAGDIVASGHGSSLFVVEVGGGGRNTGETAATADRVSGGSAGFVFAGNDALAGGAGTDRLAGDILARHATGPVTLRVAAANGGAPVGGGDGGHLNTAFVFNDVVRGGEGIGLLVGDVLRERGSGPTRLTVEAGNGGGDIEAANGFGGSGGDFARIQASSDTLSGGSQEDLIVGDLVLAWSRNDATLSVHAGNGGRHDFDFFANDGNPSGDGGHSGSVTAFSDRANSGHGDDVLVGDIYRLDTAGAVRMEAVAGHGGISGFFGGGGAGGHGNSVIGFCDTLTGGNGRDTLLGDLYLIGEGDRSAPIRFLAAAGIGGDRGDAQSNPAGKGGDDNAVVAFCDRLAGGAGDDRMAGDAAFETSSALMAPIEVTIRAGTDGFLSRNGGAGNFVDALRDTLSGGAGDDVLIGDLVFATPPNRFDIRIAGEADDEILAFADILVGGAGDDRLIGDFGGFVPDIRIDGAFVDRGALFADRLRGGDGADFLAGNLGSDTLTGGEGSDVFFFQGGDLFSIATGNSDGIPPVDVITDFSLDDILDVAVLLLTFGADETALSMRTEAGDTVLAIDQDGAGGLSAEDFVRLQDFTTHLSLEQLIELGAILIA